MSKNRKRKAGKRAEAVVDRFVRPTEAREAHNDFRSVGPAMRVTPVIDTLLEAGKLSHAHYDALRYYRDQATQAEDDCAQSSPLDPERIMGGGGGSYGGKIPAIMLATPAILTTSRIERDLRAIGLEEITRRIAVDDWSLSRWCVEKHGGRERYDGKGRFVAMVPVRERIVLSEALFELRYAAGAIVR